MAAGAERDDATPPDAVNPGLAGRKRGRRPAGDDTQAALLAAARAEFVGRGYDGATVRSIATAAGVDPAMVNHWFGSKDGLFAAAMDVPVDPDAVVGGLMAGPLEEMGTRIVRTFLAVWEPSRGGPIVALLRSASSHEGAATMLREFLSRVIFGRIATRLGSDRPQLRAALVGSQMAGLAMTRYVLRLEPVASVDTETLVAAIGPNLQRYLTGDLG